MLDWDYGSEKSLPFLANTDESSLCAPLQQYFPLYSVPSIPKNFRPSSHSTSQVGQARKDGAWRP